MKTLRSYTSDRIESIFKNNGAFFAFSQEQLDRQKQPGIEYVSMGAGLIAPKDSAQTIGQQLDNAVKEGIEADISENGIKAIIHRELANYETQITGDISDTVDALIDYGITAEQVQAEYKEFFKHCVDNDLF